MTGCSGGGGREHALSDRRWVKIGDGRRDRKLRQVSRILDLSSSGILPCIQIDLLHRRWFEICVEFQPTWPACLRLAGLLGQARLILQVSQSVLIVLLQTHLVEHRVEVLVAAVEHSCWRDETRQS